MRSDGKERDTEGPRESSSPAEEEDREVKIGEGEEVPSSPLSPPSLILLKRMSEGCGKERRVGHGPKRRKR